jgi:hypothetical protein
MDALQLVASIVSGGLAGAVVSVTSSRIFYRRALRTKLYPKVSNLYTAYLVRMESPEGQYWTGRVGFQPHQEDREFIDQRTAVALDLIEFNELEEARKLRRTLIETMSSVEVKQGEPFKSDLKPELDAISECMNILHKKLRLD